jgi:tetratricopeptide (TPR) repeat protein
MTATASPPTLHPEHAPDRDRSRRRARFIGPAIVLLVAGLAVGRGISSESNSSAPATPSDDGVAGALDQLRIAAETEATSIEAWITYANASLEAAVASGDRGQYIAAKDAFDTALRLGPNSPEAVTARAAFALNAHDFATALTLAERAVELNPYNPAALAALVDARVETGRYDEADGALAALLDIEPGFAAYARVSYLRELRGDLDGARTAMQQAVASASSGADRAALLVFLGDVQLQSGRLDAANDAYGRALADDPGSAAAMVGQARVLVARGSLEQAAALLDTAIELGPETTPAIVRGEVALLLNDSVGADEAFRIAREKDDRLRDRGEATDLDSATFLADYGNGGGDLAEAVRRAGAGYAIRTTVLGADAVAWSLFAAGNLDDARALVDAALVTDIASPTVRVHAAAILAASGEPDRASQELATAFAGAPWGDLSILPTATRLAVELDIPLPPSWTIPAR